MPKKRKNNNLKSLFKTSVFRDIVSFFYENPGSIDTAKGISTWVRKNRTEVVNILNQLVDFGILESLKTTSTTGYSITRNRKILSEIKKIIKK